MSGYFEIFHTHYFILNELKKQKSTLIRQYWYDLENKFRGLNFNVNKVKSPFRRLVCVTQDENGDVKKVLVNKKSEAEPLSSNDTKDLQYLFLFTQSILLKRRRYNKTFGTLHVAHSLMRLILAFYDSAPNS